MPKFYMDFSGKWFLEFQMQKLKPQFEMIIIMMYDQGKDYYKILGIDRFSNQEQIKKAYKKLAITHHPDKSQLNQASSVEIFREISEAYGVLSDPERRKNYDIYGFNPIVLNGAGFNFKDAQSLFRTFFQTSYFDDKMDEEDSADSFPQRDRPSTTKPYDHLFNNPQTAANNFGFFASFSKQSQYHVPQGDPSSHLTEIGGEAISKSVSTATKTINGQTITIRRTTIKKKDGTKDVTEETIDENGVVQKLYCLGPGESFGNKTVNYQ